MGKNTTLMAAATLLVAGTASADPFFVEPDVEVLASFFAENPGDNFGFVSERIGDLNGDGSPEYMIGAPTFPAGVLIGKIYVYSGVDGTVISTFTGTAGDGLGFSVAGVGDVDDDGVPDYATGGPFGANGRVVVFSGADHSIVYDLASTPGSGFGYDINTAGDVNDDGYADIVVGSLTGGVTFTTPGAVTVISGATGEALWEAEGFGDANNFGAGVSGLMGDVTGDGVPEQVVGAPLAGANGTGPRLYPVGPRRQPAIGYSSPWRQRVT